MTSTSNPIPPSQDSFKIRTMQDDLSGLKASDQIETVSTEGKVFSPAQPSVPFLEKPAQEVAKSEAMNPFAEKAEFGPSIMEVDSPENFSENNNSPASKLIWIFVVVLAISIVGLGGYYFWMTRSPKQALEVAPAAPIEETTPVSPIETPPETITTPEEKYFSDKPNYLVLDIATISTVDIKNSITKIATELKSGDSQKLYEFIVVDANNNPVVFHIFATAAELKLSSNILSSLGADFSLFLYNDGGNMRLGLSVPTTNAEMLATELQKQEKTLPADISFMLLDAKPEVLTGTFTDGVYGKYTNRHLNLDIQQALSIDYTINENILLVGTSKQTLRSMLDKEPKSSPQAAFQKQSQENISNPNTSSPSDLVPDISVSPQDISASQ